MRKNLSKQQQKRPWRTPSPSFHNNIQSPRNILRPMLIHGQSSKHLIQKTTSKSKPLLVNLKNQLVQLKQQANKLPNNFSYVNLSNQFPYNDYMPIDGQEADNMQQQNKHIYQDYGIQQNSRNSTNQIDCYNQYFNKDSSLHLKTIKNNNTSKSSKSIRQIIHKNQQLLKERGNDKQKDKQKQKFKCFSILNRNYQQNKKHSQQIQKLKSNYKQLQQNYTKILQHSKKIQNQLQQNKIQIFTLKKKLQQKKYKQQILNQQIITYKQQIQKITNQLNNSNLQIYKMKQQFYQLQLFSQKQKLEFDKISQNKIQQKMKNIPHKNQTSFINVNNVNNVNVNICQNCKIYKKSINYLNLTNQNKTLELGKKNNIIQTLCNDVQKLKSQSRMFENPKAAIKKFGTVVQSANQMVVIDRIKMLNKKYKSIMMIDKDKDKEKEN